MLAARTMITETRTERRIALKLVVCVTEIRDQPYLFVRTMSEWFMGVDGASYMRMDARMHSTAGWWGTMSTFIAQVVGKR
jgi:hypothetical protein